MQSGLGLQRLKGKGMNKGALGGRLFFKSPSISVWAKQPLKLNSSKHFLFCPWKMAHPFKFFFLYLSLCETLNLQAICLTSLLKESANVPNPFAHIKSTSYSQFTQLISHLNSECTLKHTPQEIILTNPPKNVHLLLKGLRIHNSAKHLTLENCFFKEDEVEILRESLIQMNIESIKIVRGVWCSLEWTRDFSQLKRLHLEFAKFPVTQFPSTLTQLTIIGAFNELVLIDCLKDCASLDSLTVKGCSRIEIGESASFMHSIQRFTWLNNDVTNDKLLFLLSEIRRPLCIRVQFHCSFYLKHQSPLVEVVRHFSVRVPWNVLYFTRFTLWALLKNDTLQSIRIEGLIEGLMISTALDLLCNLPLKILDLSKAIIREEHSFKCHQTQHKMIALGKRMDFRFSRPNKLTSLVFIMTKANSEGQLFEPEELQNPQKLIVVGEHLETGQLIELIQNSPNLDSLKILDLESRLKLSEIANCLQKMQKLKVVRVVGNAEAGVLRESLAGKVSVIVCD